MDGAFEVIECLDCKAENQVRLGAADVVCKTDGCGRRFRVWSKKKRHDAPEFYASQPSVRRKRFRPLPSSRCAVSFVYDEVPRFLPAGLMDLIQDMEALRLLLLGVCEQIGLPLLILYPVDTSSSDEGTNSAKRIDLYSSRGSMSLACGLIRLLAGEEACKACDEDRLKHALGETQHSDTTDLPKRYPCWAGRTEFDYPIRVNGILMAVFVAGQFFWDTPEGRRELEAGIAELERAIPGLREGKHVECSRLKEAGISPREIGELLEKTVTEETTDLVMSTNDIRKLMTAEARKQGRVIRSEEELTKWRTKISGVVQVVVDYLTMLYREHRKLREREFLSELFALLDSIPFSLQKEENAVWSDTARLVRRIAEFQGFRNGAIYFATSNDPQRVRLGAWYTSENELEEKDTYRSLSLTKDYYELLDDRAFDWYDAEHNPWNTRTQGLVDEVHRMIVGEVSNTSCGYVGFLRLRDDEGSKTSGVNKESVARPTSPFALLLLWERLPTVLEGSSSIISDHTQEFFKHLCFELSGGLRSWLSLLSLGRAEDNRRQLVANGVHGLRSSLHRVGAKAEVIEAILEWPDNLEETAIRPLLAGIQGDVDTFRHQIELANLFTVSDASSLKPRIEHEHSLGKLVAGCVKRLTDVARRRGIDIRVENGLTSTDRFLCDPGAMDVALMNVLDNAVKYSFEKRFVTVKLYHETKRLIVEIEDFGQGIPQEEHEKIFEKFYRSKTMDPLRYVPGTGIGLTVARDVIKAHGGTITVGVERGIRPSGEPRSRVSGYLVKFTIALPQKRKGRS